MLVENLTAEDAGDAEVAQRKQSNQDLRAQEASTLKFRHVATR
jgi:hypothetical protein